MYFLYHKLYYYMILYWFASIESWLPDFFPPRISSVASAFRGSSFCLRQPLAALLSPLQLSHALLVLFCSVGLLFLVTHVSIDSVVICLHRCCIFSSFRSGRVCVMNTVSCISSGTCPKASWESRAREWKFTVLGPGQSLSRWHCCSGRLRQQTPPRGAHPHPRWHKMSPAFFASAKLKLLLPLHIIFLALFKGDLSMSLCFGCKSMSGFLCCR